ncbi:SRPBCC family protein [Blastococcus deserti]|uniref:SRPBCC family protein n=1 Tax=Blastococcus deserti TaxID=2259033 RepID=A0ABW4XJQ7_9ACTN
MFRYQTTIDVNATSAKTMSYLCDVERQPEWQPDIRSCSWDAAGPTEVGKTARQVLRLLGREREATLTVDAHEPERRIRFTKVIPFPIRFGWRLEPIGEASTRIFYEVEAEPRGTFRLLSPLIAPGVRRTMEKEIRIIKDRVESLP